MNLFHLIYANSADDSITRQGSFTTLEKAQEIANNIQHQVCDSYDLEPYTWEDVTSMVWHTREEDTFLIHTGDGNLLSAEEVFYSRFGR